MNRWAAFWSRPVPVRELRLRISWIWGSIAAAIGLRLLGETRLGRFFLLFAVWMSAFTAYRLYMANRSETKQ